MKSDRDRERRTGEKEQRNDPEHAATLGATIDLLRFSFLLPVKLRTE